MECFHVNSIPPKKVTFDWNLLERDKWQALSNHVGWLAMSFSTSKSKGCCMMFHLPDMWLRNYVKNSFVKEIRFGIPKLGTNIWTSLNWNSKALIILLFSRILKMIQVMMSALPPQKIKEACPVIEAALATTTAVAEPGTVHRKGKGGSIPVKHRSTAKTQCNRSLHPIIISWTQKEDRQAKLFIHPMEVFQVSRLNHWKDLTQIFPVPCPQRETRQGNSRKTKSKRPVKRRPTCMTSRLIKAKSLLNKRKQTSNKIRQLRTQIALIKSEHVWFWLGCPWKNLLKWDVRQITR